MAFLSLNDLTSKAQSAFKRFPLTILWALCGTLYAIWVVDAPKEANTDNQTNIILTFILGVSWLIGSQFFLEQLKNSKKAIWLKPVLLLLLFLFYWHLPEVDTFDDDPIYLVRFFLFLIAGHLFVLFAPFLFKWNKNAYWNYLKAAGFAIVRSGFFSGVLYLGLVLALLAIDALFNMRIDGDIYFQLFLFCLGVVNTWIYLSDFPKNIHQQKEIHFNKALEVFVKYILIPLVILYLLILYSYSIKILVEWELPKGWVSYLVTALAFLGFTVQVIINPIHETVKSWTIKRFYPWFYILILPLLVLLFIAIFRRVSDYGITENRYFVILLAFWILGISLFLLFSRKKSLLILPFSLFILAILSSFGFWSASSVSLKSQTHQFQIVYENVLQNNRLATSDQYNQLTSILKYLDDRKSVNQLNSITGIEIKDIFKDTFSDEPEVFNWFDSQKVLDSLDIALAPNEFGSEARNTKYFNYYADRQQAQNYTLKGYHDLAVFTINENISTNASIGVYTIDYDHKNNFLSLLAPKDSLTLHEIQLLPKLRDLSKRGTNLYNIDPEQMIMEVEHENISVKIIFDELNFRKMGDSLHLSSARIFLFLKQK
ncbi:DUF4153 domain-containing protein [Zobellia russellii]|uniref:DUF4153 domain-containing protein n=1 Tax=Zobellia russellii TaxID=248907 RepID=UPI001BFF17F5|nr:DUF4153 domain-containing protein [Zobellia russellii]MBT9186864.1 DUF4153 domain-containing protein [Zobellia russellii]